MATSEELRTVTEESLKTEIDRALDLQLEEVERIGKAVDKEAKLTANGEALTPYQEKMMEQKQKVRKVFDKAVGQTRKIILMMVYDELTIAEIAPILGFSYKLIQFVAASPLFRAELKKEIAVKEKLYRDGALSELANKVVVKYNEVLEKGKLVFDDVDAAGKPRTHTVYVKGKDIIDMGRTILEMAGHGEKSQVVKHDHSSLSDAIVKAHEEIDRADAETKAQEGVIDAEVIDTTDSTAFAEATESKEDIEALEDFGEWSNEPEPEAEKGVETSNHE